MNTPEEQKQLSESLLAACKAAGIEKPRYVLQGASRAVYHSDHDPRMHNGRYNFGNAVYINHPPYASDWQDSLLEWVEPQIKTLASKSKEWFKQSAIIEGDSEISAGLAHLHGGMATYKSPEDWAKAHKGEFLSEWQNGFKFTYQESKHIEDYAVAENEPLADVLARHPESGKWCVTIETERNNDGEPTAYMIRDYKGGIVQMVRRPDHIADTSKKVDDACKIAYRKFTNDPKVYSMDCASIYRRAWSDALAWSQAEKGGEKL